MVEVKSARQLWVQEIADLCLYGVVRSIQWIGIRLPRRLSLIIIEFVLGIILVLKPKYRAISLRNISQVFPEEGPDFQDRLYRKSISAFARFVFDMIRFPSLSEEWIREHVSWPKELTEHLLRRPSNSGVLFLTGHLGSFDMLARTIAGNGFPLEVVAREFKHRRVNEWWRTIRSRFGVEVIGRKGALRQVVKGLKRGKHIGVAFDQNVTRGIAIFVDFFGRPAATSFTPAYAILETSASVVVLTIRYCGNDHYTVDYRLCDFHGACRDEGLSRNEKIHHITQEITKQFECLLLLQPEAWFWMHRRWKTTPEGEPETFYQGLEIRTSSGS
jgi:Kdo2-lipid IVA lauroyltransferase/acyltransferase